MTEASANPDGLSVLDRPNSYIGKTVPRPNLERLMQGRGLYVSDMVLPRMAHVVFLRSPHAHAKIVKIDADAAKRVPGVIAVVTGKELAAVITPWVGVLVASEGPQIRATTRHRDRPRLLAGRSGRRHRGDEPRGRGRRGGNRLGRISKSSTR